MFRIGCCLVGKLPVLSGTEDLKSHDCCDARALEIVRRCCVPDVPLSGTVDRVCA